MVKIDLRNLIGGQEKITPEKIQAMLAPPSRRVLTSVWEVLNEPRREDETWNLGMPLKCYARAFDEVFTPQINHIRWREGRNHTYYTYLKNVDEDDLEEINQWLKKMEGWIGIRDCLPVSFALDFDREDGNPALGKTEIGSLREAAKPYDQPAQRSNYRAARQLAEKCLVFLDKVKCYDSLDTVIAIPPSMPKREYHLSSVIASHVANDWEREDLSDAVKKVTKTEQVKNLPLEKKLQTIEGSIEVISEVEGKKVLLIDDLYQSGITMNWVAMQLLEAGAKRVFGLACEKTCSNDDNISG